MSEVQNNAVLSSQSADSVDSLKQAGSTDSVLDANGELILSKSKARSLRRKRAKQLKKNGGLQVQEEKKVESQDNDNNGAPPSAQYDQSTKKKSKKKSKKKKAKAKVEEVNNDVVVINSNTEAISSAAATKDSPDVNIEIENPKAENTSKTDVESSAKSSSPVKKEAAPQVVDSVTLSVESRVASKPGNASGTVYDDDNETEKGKKEDCACACVIS